MDTTQENRAVDGYLFLNEKDAGLAELERKKIHYLEEHMDYSQPETILKIYEKAINDRVFKTPVGLDYLRGIRSFLLEQEDISPEQVIPIPLYQNFGGEVRENIVVVKNRVKPSDKKKKEETASAFHISVILNVLLVIAIIAMFVISLKADQPNILNYERVITDRYAAWEQELTERELAVREKERELHIERTEQ